jgi:hypothetical protein
MAGFDLLGRLFSLARNRDGQFHALEPQALPPGPPPPRPPGDPEQCIHVAVATKLLDGWHGQPAPGPWCRTR